MTATHEIQAGTAKTLTVVKTVTGAMAGYVANGKFDITVDCTGFASPVTLQLANGASDNSLRADENATCTVTETVPAGVINSGYTNLASISPAAFTVVGDQTITVSNLVESGTVAKEWMTVEKVIGGQTSEHIATNEFGMVVSCATATHPEFKLKGGQSARLEVPVGETCDITEPTVPNPNTGYRYLKAIQPSQVAVVTGTEEMVTVTNSVVPSTVIPRDFSLTNVLSGVAPATAGYNEAQSFVGSIACTGDSGLIYATNLKRGIKGSYQVGQGDTCTVTTTTKPGLGAGYTWYSETYNPTSPVAAGTTTVDMTATHTIWDASANVAIEVTKEVSGNTNANWPTTFEIKVDCGAGNVSGPSTFNLGDGGSGTHHATPGSSCTVTETAFTPTPSAIGYSYRTTITSDVVAQPTVNASSNTTDTVHTFTLGATNANVIVANTSERSDGKQRVRVTVRVGGVDATEAAKFAGVEFPVNVRCWGTNDLTQPATYNAVGNITPMGYVAFNLDDSLDDGAVTSAGDVADNVLCRVRMQDAMGTVPTPAVTGYSKFTALVAPQTSIPAPPRATGGNTQMVREVVINVVPRQ